MALLLKLLKDNFQNYMISPFKQTNRVSRFMGFERKFGPNIRHACIPMHQSVSGFSEIPSILISCGVPARN